MTVSATSRDVPVAEAHVAQDTDGIDREALLHADRRTSQALQQHAQTLIRQNMSSAALSVLSTALMIDPAPGTIRQIGQCLEALGMEDDALLCYRGVIPDSVNRDYLDAEALTPCIKEASACEQIACHQAYEYESVKLSWPNRNQIDKKYGQFNYRNTEARASFCTVAINGSVWFDGFNTAAFDSAGNIVKEHIKGNEFACYHTSRLTTPHKLSGTVCFLDGRSSDIYYHWMLDILPKLGVVEKAGIALDEIDYFIVRAQSRYQKETLRLLGVQQDRIVNSGGNQFYTADKMIVPFLRNDLGERVYTGLGVGLATWIPKYLQRAFMPESMTGTDTARIYISRSSRGSRNIASEPELISQLEDRGFETVEFEHLSVPEQAELMSRAEVVIGVHGAGFTNLSFCNSGTRVVEIFGDYVVPCYWALSAVASLDYTQFMAKSVADNSCISNPGEQVSNLRDRQIDIDVAEFISYLDSVLP